MRMHLCSIKWEWTKENKFQKIHNGSVKNLKCIFLYTSKKKSTAVRGHYLDVCEKGWFEKGKGMIVFNTNCCHWALKLWTYANNNGYLFSMCGCCCCGRTGRDFIPILATGFSLTYKHIFIKGFLFFGAIVWTWIDIKRFSHWQPWKFFQQSRLCWFQSKKRFCDADGGKIQILLKCFLMICIDFENKKSWKSF